MTFGGSERTRCKAAEGEDDGSVLLYVTESETRWQRRRLYVITHQNKF